MMTNRYIPPLLPLVSDGELLRLCRAYDTALSDDEVQKVHGPAELSALRAALDAIERELQARGIGGEPWWAVGRVITPSVRRPSRRRHTISLKVRSAT